MLVIDTGRLIDGTGNDAIADARLVVDDEGRVADVGPAESVAAPDGAEQVSYPEKTAVPGLIDAHLHLQGSRSMDPMSWVTDGDALSAARATADLHDLVAAGFTSVRDVGSTTALGLRQAVDEGDVPGPRIFTSGQSLSQTGGHGDVHSLPYDWVASGEAAISTLADGPDECRREVRKRLRDGADLIKIMTTGGVLSERDDPAQTQFTEAEVRAIVEEAHRAGIPVASHAQGTAGVKLALENGVDTIEHGFYLDDETLGLFAETGAIFVPTLAIMHRIVDEGADYGVPEHSLRKARAAAEAHFESTRRAYEAGVPIATGTDFLGADLVPHGENAIEAELLVAEIGMSEREAVAAATGVAGRALPTDEVGTLEPGRLADLAVLEANPHEDVTALREVAATYVGGERIV
ncbi:MAG: amidohydrolase family protein [Halanaeroarchaeum sp.]